MPDSHAARGPMPDPAARRGAEGAPYTDGASLLDVLDRVLERGIVVEASATGALPALDIAGGEATVSVASSEPVPAAGEGWEALAAVVAAAGAERAAPSPDAARPAEGAGRGDDVWRSGEHAALKRQFERLNA